MEVGVVLADESFTEQRRDENARREVRVFEEGEAITHEQGVRWDICEESGVVGLGLFPVGNGGREGGVARASEVFEEGWGTL